MAPRSLLTQEPLTPETERESFPVLILHGYEIHAEGRLGSLSQAICESALRLLEMNGDLRAIILGGWHLKETGELTIADAMESFLVHGKISPRRIITQQSFASLDNTMPPRDSWEEILLLLQIIGRLGICPEAPLMSVAWDFHIPRLKRMYAAHGITDTEFVPAIPSAYDGLKKRKWMERAARIIQWIDPWGTGIACHAVRIGRTIHEDFKPLIP